MGRGEGGETMGRRVICRWSGECWNCRNESLVKSETGQGGVWDVQLRVE